MGKIIKTNLPCKKCSSSDARRLYEDGTSYCWSCKSWFPVDKDEVGDMQTPAPKFKAPASTHTPNYGGISLEAISELPVKGLKERDITRQVCEHFDVRCSTDTNGLIDAHYYPYTNANGGISYKRRHVATKQFMWIGTAGDLFGMDKFSPGGKRLIITEGEIDAMSVAQAHLDHYQKIYPVISLTSAAGTEKVLKHRDWIRSFQEVVIWMDNDQAGGDALEKILRIVGVDKAKIVKSPAGCKDASDVLQNLGLKALIQAVWDASPWTPAGIIKKEELWEAMCNYNNIASVLYPECLSGVNAKLKGMRLGEIVLFISGTGCLARGTSVMRYDGTVCPVENVRVGDKLMGDDNTPREVLELKRGEEQMFRITLRDGTQFVCNESHVLTLVNNDNEGRWGLSSGDLVDVSVRDYLRWSDKRKHLSKAIKSPGINLQERHDLLIPPYVLGVWLGDGYSDGGRFACADGDAAIIEQIRAYGYTVTKGDAPFMWNAPGRLRAELDREHVRMNKHIPEKYLLGSTAQRLLLLAGLLDTDGSYDTQRAGYEFSQKSLEMTEQVRRLAESLGFACSVGKQKNNKFGNCYRLYISGNGLDAIPCVLPRKQARVRLQKKDPNRYSFTVTPLSVDDYYGFTLDGNSRFLLGNFVVTHNSGKSTMLREIMLHLLGSEQVPKEDRIGVVSLEEAPAETARKLSGMKIFKNPAEEEIPIEDLKIGFDQVFGDDRIILLDHQGSIADGSIVEQLEYMALMGCKYIFIDHITILVSEGADGLTGNEAQDKVMNDLLRLVKRHNVWIGLVSHLRKAPVGKKSFEEGVLPSLDDIRGSGSIKQVSFDILAFARNMTADNPTVRNTIKMAILKSRYTGLTGGVPGAFYDGHTGRLVYSDSAPVEGFTHIE